MTPKAKNDVLGVSLKTGFVLVSAVSQANDLLFFARKRESFFFLALFFARKREQFLWCFFDVFLCFCAFGGQICFFLFVCSSRVSANFLLLFFVVVFCFVLR